MSSAEEIVRTVIVSAPFGQLLGLVAERVEPDRVSVRLPFRPQLTTVGDVVHGGAISALIDVAATAAVWAGADVTQQRRGATAAITVTYLAPGTGQDLVATAEVIRRGRSLCVCDVTVDGAKGERVARALVTYKISQ
jgi:uncharacterized protein (TIGR00369 family)